MDYIFPFGTVKKIYRLDDQGIGVCTEKNGSIEVRKTISWNRILGAGEGVMASPAYQVSREVARAMMNALPQGGRAEQFERARAAAQQFTGYVMIAYCNGPSERKKMEILPIDVFAPRRVSLLQDLSAHLGDRWLGEGQDPSDLKKRLGVPLVYQIRGTLVFIGLMLVFAAFIYFSYFK